jgi:hypothetical protein
MNKAQAILASAQNSDPSQNQVAHVVHNSKQQQQLAVQAKLLCISKNQHGYCQACMQESTRTRTAAQPLAVRVFGQQKHVVHHIHAAVMPVPVPALHAHKTQKLANTMHFTKQHKRL